MVCQGAQAGEKRQWIYLRFSCTSLCTMTLVLLKDVMSSLDVGVRPCTDAKKNCYSLPKWQSVLSLLCFWLPSVPSSLHRHFFIVRLSSLRKLCLVSPFSFHAFGQRDQQISLLVFCPQGILLTMET